MKNLAELKQSVKSLKENNELLKSLFRSSEFQISMSDISNNNGQINLGSFEVDDSTIVVNKGKVINDKWVARDLRTVKHVKPIKTDEQLSDNGLNDDDYTGIYLLRDSKGSECYCKLNGNFDNGTTINIVASIGNYKGTDFVSLEGKKVTV